MTRNSERQCARFIYTKSKKNAKHLYIYSKGQTLFKKQDNLRYIFIHKNPNTLLYEILYKCLKLAFMYIYKKHDTFSYVDFLYTKIQTLLRKKQDNLRYFFIYTKSLTLCVTRFYMEFFKLAEGGGHFYRQKTMYFEVNFYI